LRGAWLGDAGHHPNTLLRNDGATFTDVTESSGILSFPPTQTADWGDYDRDGDLDLFVGNESAGSEVHPCELFENQGDGTFVEVADKVGLQHIAYVKGVAWGDIDNDGDLDLYLSTMGSSNALYENLGPASEGEKPRFRDITEGAEVGAPQLSFPTWFWDYDHDGRLDILAGSYGSFEESMLEGVVADYLGQPTADEGIRLYKNLGGGDSRRYLRRWGFGVPSSLWAPTSEISMETAGSTPTLEPVSQTWPPWSRTGCSEMPRADDSRMSPPAVALAICRRATGSHLATSTTMATRTSS
ncbi:MAG TPA: VCBS repeat-containing protein, partial [Planctomycetes bacterium]|nr:VCBS repeat-containing protein [Planctomycetota bacterium]